MRVEFSHGEKQPVPLADGHAGSKMACQKDTAKESKACFQQGFLLSTIRLFPLEKRPHTLAGQVIDWPASPPQMFFFLFGRFAAARRHCLIPGLRIFHLLIIVFCKNPHLPQAAITCFADNDMVKYWQLHKFSTFYHELT